MLINITESTYIRGDHHLWLILMMVIWKVPQIHEAMALRPIATNAGQPAMEEVEDVPSAVHEIHVSSITKRQP